MKKIFYFLFMIMLFNEVWAQQPEEESPFNKRLFGYDVSIGFFSPNFENTKSLFYTTGVGLNYIQPLKNNNDKRNSIYSLNVSLRYWSTLINDQQYVNEQNAISIATLIRFSLRNHPLKEKWRTNVSLGPELSSNFIDFNEFESRTYNVMIQSELSFSRFKETAIISTFDLGIITRYNVGSNQQMRYSAALFVRSFF